MASILEQLLAQFNGYQPYQGLTEEEIARKASQRYQGVYDQKRLSARQAAEQSDAALAHELSALQATYDQQRAQSRQQTQQNYLQANRQSLSRGMQRSSFNNANLSNIHLAGAAALDALGQRQRGEEGRIGQQRAQLSQQLARQLAQYDASQQADTLAYADELENREYNRRIQSQTQWQNLAAQLYQFQHQLEQEAQAQANWQAQFDAQHGAKSRPSGGGGKKKKDDGTLPARTGGSGVRPEKNLMV